MISEILQKAIKTNRERGSGELFRRILSRMSRLVFETNSATWYIRILYSKDTEIKADIPLTANFLDFNQTFNWIKLQNKPWMLNDVEKEVAVREGHYWGNVKYNGIIIGYIKCGFNNVYINDYKKTVTFSRNVGFIYDTFILTEFRGRRVASYLINETCTFLKKNGFSKVICHIPSWNIASIKAYSRAGLKRTKKIRYLKILGFKILTSNPAYL